MAQVASLATLEMNNQQFTAPAEWTLGLGGRSLNAFRNITGTPTSTQDVPEMDSCEGSIRYEDKASVVSLLAARNFTLVGVLLNGDTYRLTQANVTNHPNLNTDGGVIDLTVEGIGGFL